MDTRWRRGKRVGAELVLIVTGVLLALWGEGQVDTLRERARLRAQLEALRGELLRAGEDLTGYLATLPTRSAAHRELAAVSQGGTPPSPDSLAALINTSLLVWIEYRPGLTALRDLQDSGRLPLIRRDSLRRALAGLDDELRYNDGQIAINMTGPQQDLYDPFVIENFPSVLEGAAARLDTAFPRQTSASPDWSAIRSNKGRGLIAFRSHVTRDMKRNLEHLAEQMASVVSEIEKEIAR